MKKITSPGTLHHDFPASVLLEVPEDSADMADVDSPCRKDTEDVLVVGCDDDVAFRDLECHVDK